MKTKDIKFKMWGNNGKVMYDVDCLNFKEDYLECSNKYGGSWNDGLSDNENEEYYTLLLYTGFKDIAGKEIYEGDILKQEDNDWCLLKVEFVEGGIGVFEINEAEEYTGSIYEIAHHYRDITVIGNIYENPELLKEG